MTMLIQSSAFKDQGHIPSQYTCEGEDRSPPLNFISVPPGTKSLALIVDDPDAPDPNAPKMTYVHWVLYNIPPETSELAEAVSGKNLPTGAIEGQNDWQRKGYGGPCPPIGTHRYFFKLYALDTVLEPIEPGTKFQLEEAMEDHVIEEATLMGTYFLEHPKE